MALYLAQRGTPVIIMEGEGSLPLDLRASTFHPSTLDLLDSLSITDKLIAQGLIATSYQYRDRRTGEAAIFSLSSIAGSTNHPYRLQCEQFKFTQVAVDMLKEFPLAQVLFNHRLEQVVQDSERRHGTCRNTRPGFQGDPGQLSGRRRRRQQPGA